jgi:outer membrane lipoprotein-sorting protein
MEVTMFDSALPKAVPVLVATLALAVGLPARGAPSADEIIAKADAAGRADTGHTVMTQTIQTTSGNARTFTIESWSMGGDDKSLMRFLEPAPSRGIGMLSLDGGDNIWAYFPDSDDLRKIASSSRNSSMEGSDFSYEDMTGATFAEKYTAGEVVEETLDGTACYRVTLTPTGKSAYTKVVVWIDTTHYLVHRSHYFDKKDRHAKTLTLSGYRQVSGIWTPQTMVMKNERRGSITTIEMVTVEYGVAADERMFTTETLTTF